jgi:hypothetical protein
LLIFWLVSRRLNWNLIFCWEVEVSWIPQSDNYRV